MRALSRRKTTVYAVTDAAVPLSEDVLDRQRRYLFSMGVRTVCLILAVLLWGRIPWPFLAFLLVGAIFLPYVSVIFANAGRRPPKAVRLESGTALPPARGSAERSKNSTPKPLSGS